MTPNPTDVLERLRRSTFDTITADDLRDAITEIERLRHEAAMRDQREIRRSFWDGWHAALDAHARGATIGGKS